MNLCTLSSSIPHSKYISIKFQTNIILTYILTAKSKYFSVFFSFLLTPSNIENPPSHPYSLCPIYNQFFLLNVGQTKIFVFCRLIFVSVSQTTNKTDLQFSL